MHSDHRAGGIFRHIDRAIMSLVRQSLQEAVRRPAEVRRNRTGREIGTRQERYRRTGPAGLPESGAYGRSGSNGGGPARRPSMISAVPR
jgi:hypothetical protein